MLYLIVTKIELIKKYEKDISKHFSENNIPLVIPYFNTIYTALFQKGTTQAAPPMFERMEISFADWQNYVKTKEYNTDFKKVLE